MSISFFDKLKMVKHFMFDVDGVLTDNLVLLNEAGHQIRKMNIRDGYAIKKALSLGYTFTIITGGNSDGVRKRLSKLGVSNVHSGVEDKLTLFNEIADKHSWMIEEIMYMGDDIPDLQVMKKAGVACCPADAVQEVQDICDYISPRNGGDGCVRDVIEKVLKLNDDWPVS